jgi:hypothetical protein
VHLEISAAPVVMLEVFIDGLLKFLLMLMLMLMLEDLGSRARCLVTSVG